MSDDNADSAYETLTSAEGDRPSYEQAREELAEVVRRLETGGATLEESLCCGSAASSSRAICQEWLDGARARLTAAATLDSPAARTSSPPSGTAATG